MVGGQRLNSAQKCCEYAHLRREYWALHIFVRVLNGLVWCLRVRLFFSRIRKEELTLKPINRRVAHALKRCSHVRRRFRIDKNWLRVEPVPQSVRDDQVVVDGVVHTAISARARSIHSYGQTR